MGVVQEQVRELELEQVQEQVREVEQEYQVSPQVAWLNPQWVAGLECLVSSLGAVILPSRLACLALR